MMSKPLQDLLARLPASQEIDFGSLITALDATRYSGQLTIDFLNGRARQINLGQPIKLTICEGSRNGVDKGKGDKAG